MLVVNALKICPSLAFSVRMRTLLRTFDDPVLTQHQVFEPSLRPLEVWVRTSSGNEA